MVVAFVVVGVLVTVGLVSTCALSDAHGWRWSSSEEAGEGPYRRTEVAAAPGEMPALLPLSAGMGVIWGPLTSLVLGPLGILYTLLLNMACCSGSQMSVVGVVGSTVIAALSLGAIGLGFMIVRAGLSLLRARPRASERAAFVARWSLGHHVALPIAVMATGPGGQLATIVAALCAIGVLQALALRAASRAPAPAALNVSDEAARGAG